jgi:hypothetical protein
MSKRYQGGVLGVGFNPLQAPNAPTIGTATAGCSSASVAVTAPANIGGSAITGYTAQSNPGGFGGAAVGSPITVSGLTNGTAYTFGAFALNSYGPSPISAFSNSVTPAVPTGTFAIIALGRVAGCTASAIRDKYTYSGCVVSTGGAASAAAGCGYAAGNSTVGIFALGRAPTTAVTTRDKYTYAGCVVSAGGASTIASQRGSAAGNSTVGIFALGAAPSYPPIAARNKYTYAGCVVSSAAAASSPSGYGSAAGTSTAGIFALGLAQCGCGISFGYVTTRQKYTYSSCTNSAGGAATVAASSGTATGNSTVGIFSLGENCCGRLTTRDKYTYSSCAVAAGGAATTASSSGSAAGNSTVGIFSLGTTPGPSTTRNKYTYSGDVVAAGGAASAASYYGAAASNGTTGVNI